MIGELVVICRKQFYRNNEYINVKLRVILDDTVRKNICLKVHKILHSKTL